ncbi:MAG: C-terminal helicase domain-containing protein, partial [Candidatus Eisenbacteria bacterium]
ANVAAQLNHHKIPAAELHAAGDKRERQRAMDDFRSARVRVLIASDVGARGLDILGITHVVNLDAPTQSKAYLHRAGRTARAGARGQAISLMTTDEVRLVGRYQSELGIVMHRVRLREGQMIAS